MPLCRIAAAEHPNPPKYPNSWTLTLHVQRLRANAKGFHHHHTLLKDSNASIFSGSNVRGLYQSHRVRPCLQQHPTRRHWRPFAAGTLQSTWTYNQIVANLSGAIRSRDLPRPAVPGHRGARVPFDDDAPKGKKHHHRSGTRRDWSQWTQKTNSSGGVSRRLGVLKSKYGTLIAYHLSNVDHGLARCGSLAWLARKNWGKFIIFHPGTKKTEVGPPRAAEIRSKRVQKRV